MSNTNFQQLPVAIGLTGAEIVPILKDGVDMRTTTGAIGSSTFNLDLISSTPGSILYRGASAWLALAPGTLGQVLTQGASFPAWGSNDVGLTIGTTVIANGADTRILYDNAGILGEYTITGTGTVVAMQTAPTFLTSITTPRAIITQGTITADAPQIAGTVTWNNAGETFTGWSLAVTNTASADASRLLRFTVGGAMRLNVSRDGVVKVPTVATDGVSGAFDVGNAAFRSGMRNSGSNIGIDLYSNTVSTLLIDAFDATPNVQMVQSTHSFGWSDVQIWRDAADTWAQRRGTNAQALRVYNTYANGGTDFERGALAWAANRLFIGTQAGGTGTARGVTLFTEASTVGIRLNTNNTDRWEVSGDGHFLASTDNTFDIGASGATRPKDIYLAGSLVGGAFAQIGTNGAFTWGSRSFIYSPADSVILLQNNANNNFDRLLFGGTTSSFPALKRSTTVLQARLADDSGFAPLQGLLRSNANATAEVVVATHTLRIFDAAGTEYKVLAIAA